MVLNYFGHDIQVRIFKQLYSSSVFLDRGCVSLAKVYDISASLNLAVNTPDSSECSEKLLITCSGE